MSRKPPPYSGLDNDEVEATIDTRAMQRDPGGGEVDMKAMTGLAAVGGIVGFALLGPVTAVAAAGAGAAVAAGAGGEKARETGRALGTAAHALGSALWGRAKAADHKYHLVDKAKSAASAGAAKAKEIDQKYKVTDKLHEGIKKGSESLTKSLDSKK